MYCESKLSYIPLTFMLGFFVTIVVDRWRNIFVNMGWIENLALTVATLLRGDSKEAVLYRRSIIRYAVLCQVLVFRDVSMRVRRRFPNMESIVVAGFLHENELRELENIKMVYNKYWAPFNWALTICTRAYKEGCIENIPAMVAIQNEVKLFRTSLAQLCHFDWVPIPIAYPQVVFLAVRVYFVICTVSRQFILSADAKNRSAVDLFVPFMTILQFIFFVGWMKVAEALLNPLGEDDDDFECNFLIDQNIANGLSIVDNTYNTCPELLPDRLSYPNYDPIYSEESQRWGVDNTLIGSAEGIEVAKPEEHVKMVAVDVGKQEEGNHNPKSHKPSLADKIADICCVPKRRTSVYPVSQSAVHLVHYGDSPRQAIRRQPRGTQADSKTNHKPTTDSSETRKLSNEGLTTISEESDSRKSSAESEVKMNDMSRH
uniref:Bestrophin homolog n=1 Tax=Haemonchus contortus TaxID=6289 RepID=A0A7I4YQJ0_HAECO